MVTPTRDRVRKHRLDQQAKGLVEVRVWVPRDAVEKIKALAEKLRRKMVRPRSTK